MLASSASMLCAIVVSLVAAGGVGASLLICLTDLSMLSASWFVRGCRSMHATKLHGARNLPGEASVRKSRADNAPGKNQVKVKESCL